MRTTAVAVVLGWILGVAPTARAATIGFAPIAQTARIGEIVSVDLQVSGLGAGAAPSLGGFDIFVAFDPAVLNPQGMAFGPLLGDVAAFEALAVPAAEPGEIEAFEVSFLSPSELDALQPETFLLATLSFAALDAGTSALRIVSPTLLSDGFGGALPVDVVDGSVTVTAATPVPEPATALLLLTGLGCAWRVRRRSARA